MVVENNSHMGVVDLCDMRRLIEHYLMGLSGRVITTLRRGPYQTACSSFQRMKGNYRCHQFTVYRPDHNAKSYVPYSLQ